MLNLWLKKLAQAFLPMKDRKRVKKKKALLLAIFHHFPLPHKTNKKRTQKGEWGGEKGQRLVFILTIKWRIEAIIVNNFLTFYHTILSNYYYEKNIAYPL